VPYQKGRQEFRALAEDRSAAVGVACFLLADDDDVMRLESVSGETIEAVIFLVSSLFRVLFQPTASRAAPMHTRPLRRYHAAEIEADFAVHLLGTLVGAMGAAVLLALAAASADSAVLWSVLAYSVGLMAMLGFSAAYHLQRSSERRELLRRLDHAAIFLMIAGTYTPFTACILDGAYATWLTGSMWLTALGGVAVKLAYPRRFEWASTMVYLALGWAVVIFMRPLLALLDPSTLILLVSGGVLYSIGACIHRWRRLPFHDAIWHGLVLVAAGCHYAAILHSVVLIAPRS
jgi:hemolysin III